MQTSKTTAPGTANYYTTIATIDTTGTHTSVIMGGDVFLENAHLKSIFWKDSLPLTKYSEVSNPC